MASRYHKASVGKIVSIIKANKEEEEKEERILWCNSDSEESDLNIYRTKDLKLGWNNLSESYREEYNFWTQLKENFR